jgi:hypothetical protein
MHAYFTAHLPLRVLVLALLSTSIPMVSSFLPSPVASTGLPGRSVLGRHAIDRGGSLLAGKAKVTRTWTGSLVATAGAQDVAQESATAADAAGEAFNVERRRKWALRRQVWHIAEVEMR